MNSIEFSGADRAALSAALVLPKTGVPKAPGIVLLPAVAGVNEYVRRVAQRLAASGFAVVVLDYFAPKAGPPTSRPRPRSTSRLRHFPIDA